MFVTLIRIVQMFFFVTLGLVLSDTVSARPFQAEVTLNTQTRDITVTRVPDNSVIVSELPLSHKKSALLSPSDNLRTAAMALGADWNPVSVSNYDTSFHVSLDDTRLIGKHQPSIFGGNLMRMLWGVTYCGSRNEQPSLPSGIFDKSDEPSLSDQLQTIEVDRENSFETCLNQYIIQCPQGGGAVDSQYPTGFHADNTEQQYLSGIGGFLSFKESGGGGGAGGGWDSGHTFNPDVRIHCPACYNWGCQSAPWQFGVNFASDVSESDFFPDNVDLAPDNVDLVPDNVGLVPDNADFVANVNQVLHTDRKENIAKKKTPRKCSRRPSVRSTSLLYAFLLDLLCSGQNQETLQWSDTQTGTFEVKDSRGLAKKWGNHKKREGMNWDKMSRAIRTYYKDNGPIKHGEVKLEYQFNYDNQQLEDYMEEKGYKKSER